VLTFGLEPSFVDRDMLMRHHWGLGVGHSYSHSDAPASLIMARPPCTDVPLNRARSLDPSQLASGSEQRPGGDIPVPANDAEAEGDTDSDDSELQLSDKEGNDLDVDSASEPETEDKHARLEAIEEDEPPQADEQPETEVACVPEAAECTPHREPSLKPEGETEVEPEPAAPTIRRSTRVRVPQRILLSKPSS
jgi:hypothetical protein